MQRLELTSETLTVLYEKQEKANYLFFQGNLNTAAAIELKSDLPEDFLIQNLILDVSEISALSSTGIGLFFEFYDRLSKSNHKFILLNPTTKVSELLDLTGFSRLFQKATSREEAEKSIS